MGDLRNQIIRLGEQLAAEENAAHDLWTWLPSHAVAKRNHDDYASAHRPSVSDVMREAAEYLAHLKRPSEPLSVEQRRWFDECPCDEDHLP